MEISGPYSFLMKFGDFVVGMVVEPDGDLDELVASELGEAGIGRGWGLQSANFQHVRTNLLMRGWQRSHWLRLLVGLFRL